ncbi:MAG: hypothetical protein IKN57_03450, partial [Parasporobacterium sp.]|nr:hypothetical protein [Parasporobacterium sp.]
CRQSSRTLKEQRNLMKASKLLKIIRENLKDYPIDYLKNKFGAKIYNLYMPNIDISSTDIRDKVKHGMSIRYYTPDPVIEYIQENNLYKD